MEAGWCSEMFRLTLGYVWYFLLSIFLSTIDSRKCWNLTLKLTLITIVSSR